MFVLRRSLLRILTTAALVICSISLPSGLSGLSRGDRMSSIVQLAPAQAQRLRINDIWRQVYQQLPDLPREDQYINKETGDISSENTLISRLIRYHVYIKGRPPNYRLDWKLTLADYLGVNERIEPDTYPSATALRTNPVEGDIAAIQSLNRSQREALVNTLTQLFNPNAATNAEPATPAPSPTPTPSPQPPANSRFPQAPKPGDAQLLQP